MTPHRKKAFSLVEFLLVLFMISVLAGLLMPALSSFRESSRAATCMNNMRQIGVAMVNYSIDHSGNLPPANEDASLTPGNAAQDNWIGSTWTYAGLGNYQAGLNDGTRSSVANNIYVCPTTKLKKGNINDIRVPNFAATDDDRCYGMNVLPSWISTGWAIASNPYEDGRQIPTQKAQVESPRQAALLLESVQLQVAPDTFQFTVGTSGVGLLPHRNGSNILFFDGHMEFFVLRSIPPDTGTLNTLDPFWTGRR